jgi:FhuF 2Fe-2S C-terminal domain
VTSSPSGGSSHAAPDPATTPVSVSSELTALGPFFAADAHDPHTTPVSPWRPMSELVEDPAVLTTRVETSRAYLAAASGQDSSAVELRVAASITHLGLVARTLSPLFALAVLYGHSRPVGLHDLRWQPTVPSTFPLSIAGLDDTVAGPVSATPDADIDALAADLCAAVRPFGLSEHVLWGNVASALNGACTALSTAAPAHAPRARAVLAAVLHHRVLAGTAQTSLDGRFQRRSCCLIYRAAPGRAGMVCGDCILLGTRRASSVSG